MLGVFLFSVRPLVVLLPLVVAQYVLAIFALTRLAMCRLPAKKYVVWNIAIVLAFFVGSIVFLCYYYGKRRAQALAEEAAEEEARRDNAAAAGDGADGDRPQNGGEEVHSASDGDDPSGATTRGRRE